MLEALLHMLDTCDPSSQKVVPRGAWAEEIHKCTFVIFGKLIFIVKEIKFIKLIQQKYLQLSSVNFAFTA